MAKAKAKALPATAVDLEGIDSNKACFGKVGLQAPGPWLKRTPIVQINTLSFQGLSVQDYCVWLASPSHALSEHLLAACRSTGSSVSTPASSAASSASTLASLPAASMLCTLLKWGLTRARSRCQHAS